MNNRSCDGNTAVTESIGNRVNPDGMMNALSITS